MDVQDIVWEHLKRVGATGLCNESCGCEAPDLMPCDNCTRSCVPAVRRKCGPDCEECGGDGGCMTPLEPVAKARADKLGMICRLTDENGRDYSSSPSSVKERSHSSAAINMARAPVE